MTRILNNSLHINQVTFCELSVILNGVAEDSLFLGYDVVSVSNWSEYFE